MVDINKIKALAAQAAEIEDQTETEEFQGNLPEVGPTVCRFVDYIDLGKQPRNPYQGKPKPPADTILLAFDLLSPQNIHAPSGNMPNPWCDRVVVKITKSINEKAGFKKLFLKMTYGRPDIVHMAQMLGEAFIVDIAHTGGQIGTDGKKGRPYVSIKDASKEWTIRPPFFLDPLTKTRTDVPVPPPMSPLRAFVWALADKESWDSLFIEGSYEKKDPAGNVTNVSKNWIQEAILKATDLAGSPVEQVIKGLVADLPITQTAQTTTTTTQTPAAALPAASAAAPATTPAANPLLPARDALVASGMSREQANATLGIVEAPAAPEPVDPLAAAKAALRATGMTEEQIVATLGGAPAQPAANPTQEKPKGNGGRPKKDAAATTATNAAQAETQPATANATAATASPSNVTAALAALGLAK